MSDTIDNANATALAEQEALIFKHQQSRQYRIPSNGVCEECGDPIPLTRLEFDPTFSRCLSCQMDHEKRTKHVRHY